MRQRLNRHLSRIRHTAGSGLSNAIGRDRHHRQRSRPGRSTARALSNSQQQPAAFTRPLRHLPVAPSLLPTRRRRTRSLKSSPTTGPATAAHPDQWRRLRRRGRLRPADLTRTRHYRSTAQGRDQTRQTPLNRHPSRRQTDLCPTGQPLILFHDLQTVCRRVPASRPGLHPRALPNGKITTQPK